MQKFPFYLIKRPFSFSCKTPVIHSRKCTTFVIDEYDFEHFFFHHYNKKEATSSILVVFSWWKPAIVEAKASMTHAQLVSQLICVQLVLLD